MSTPTYIYIHIYINSVFVSLQGVKVVSARSQWQSMQNGTARIDIESSFIQRIYKWYHLSITRRVFLNLSNYADDSTICCSHSGVNILKMIVKSANLVLKWFENNHVKANASKLQALSFKCRTMKKFSISILYISRMKNIVLEILKSAEGWNSIWAPAFPFPPQLTVHVVGLK